jgi:hypothetical protein
LYQHPKLTCEFIKTTLEQIAEYLVENALKQLSIEEENFQQRIISSPLAKEIQIAFQNHLDKIHKRMHFSGYSTSYSFHSLQRSRQAVGKH